MLCLELLLMRPRTARHLAQIVPPARPAIHLWPRVRARSRGFPRAVMARPLCNDLWPPGVHYQYSNTALDVLSGVRYVSSAEHIS